MQSSVQLDITEKNLDNLSGVIDHPLGNLIFDKSGNLYGTAVDGGAKRLRCVFELIRRQMGVQANRALQLRRLSCGCAGPSADLSLTGPVIFTEPLSMVGRAQTARELC